MRVEQIQHEWRAQVGRIRNGSSTDLLLKSLVGAPVLTVGSAADLIGRSFPQTNEAIERLVSAGVLSQVRVSKRNRVFEASAIINAFTDLERQLASPAGDTRSSEPVRPVPPRRPTSLLRFLRVNLNKKFNIKVDAVATVRISSKVGCAGNFIRPVGFQKSATGPDLVLYAARSYSLMRAPRTVGDGSAPERSAAEWSGRGGRSWRLRWCACRKCHLCRLSSVLVPVEDAAETIASADMKVGGGGQFRDRPGQRAQWPGVRDALMRPMGVAGLLEFTQRVQQVPLVPDQGSAGQLAAGLHPIAP
jgi:hypothetical protein